MSRLSLFSNPVLLGFDQLERSLDRIAKAAADGYPPYNIEQIGDCQLRITLAVAGFDAASLNVSVEERQLVIRGKQAEEGADAQRVYLHRGIAARPFQRSFLLAEGLRVTDAMLDNGLLHIDLERVVPERLVQTIAVREGATGEMVQQPALGPTAAKRNGGRQSGG
jgi:HSP20 family molecular chaperone IbpA